MLSLTGFRHIAQEIQKYGDVKGGSFEFGYEESFGYLVGKDVRDKDAVVSCLMIADIAAVAAENDETLVDCVEKMYRKYGFAAENTISIYREGKVGQEKIAYAMNGLRENPLDEFESLGIQTLSDFKVGEVVNFATERKRHLISRKATSFFTNWTGTISCV